MVIDSLLYELGIETDSKSFKNATSALADLRDKSLALFTTVTSVATAFTGWATFVNHGTRETVNLAKAVGVSTETLQAFGGAVSAAGFNIDNVADLIEEMNNKLGESGASKEEITAVKDSLKMLGLEYKNIKELSPEEQFKKIADAALKLEDAQRASSAMDILMGGEASKMFGYLRRSGKSLDDIIQGFREISFETKESQAGAVEYTNAIGGIKKMFDSLGRFVAGEFGRKVAPVLKEFKEDILKNKDAIIETSKVVLSGITAFIQGLGRAISFIVSKISAVINALGGFRRLAKIIGITALIAAAAKVVETIKLIGIALSGAAGSAGALTLVASFVKVLSLVTAIYLLLESIITWTEGGKSVVGDIIGVDFETWKQQFADIMSWGAETWGQVFFQLLGEAKAQLAEIGNSLLQTAIQFKDYLVQAGQNFIQTILNGMNAIWNAFIAIAKNFIQTIINGIGGMLSSFGGKVKGALSGAAKFLGLGGEQTPQQQSMVRAMQMQPNFNADNKTSIPVTVNNQVQPQTQISVMIDGKNIPATKQETTTLATRTKVNQSQVRSV